MYDNDTRAEKGLAVLERYNRGRILPAAYAALAFPILVYHLCYQIIPENVILNLRPAAQIITFLFGLFCFVMLPKDRPLELRLLIQNVCWLLFTRMLRYDLHYGLNNVCYWAVLFCAFFALGPALDRKQRARFFDVFTAFYCGILFVLAVSAIATALNGGPLSESFLFFPYIHLRCENFHATPFIYIEMLGLHRNHTSFFFVPAICLAAYQSFRHRKRWLTICTAVAVAVWYLTLSLQKCRSVYVATAVSLAMILGILLYERIGKRGRVVPKLAVSGAILLLTVVFCLGFSKCSDLLASVARPPRESQIVGLAPAPVQEPSASGEETPADREEIRISDPRSTLQDARTMTNRTRLWKAILPTLREGKSIAVIGLPEDEVMDKVCQKAGRQYVHMHNMLFQQLMLAGVPGFLLYLLLLLSLLVRMVKCYFSAEPAVLPEHKVLAVGLAGPMIYGLIEPLMSGNLGVGSFLFCLLAGLFVSELRELRPADAERPAR